MVGQLVQVAAALVTVPFIIRGLGTEKFGLLSLAWVVVGYFSLFDLGLGRAITKHVANALALGDKALLGGTVVTGLSLVAGLGVIGGLSLGLFAPALVGHLLRTPAGLQTEAVGAFRILALGVPIAVLSVGFQGVLEAHQRFDLTNAVRTPMGVFISTSPLIVLQFSKSLLPMIGVMVVGRLAALVALLTICLRIVPQLRDTGRFRPDLLRDLLTFGLWVTVSNIVGPLMVYLDRFVIGALISISAVAYYAAPHDAVTRMWLLADSLLVVLFPAFVGALARDRDQASKLFDRGLRYLLGVTYLPTLIAVTLAHELLAFWLGGDFPRQSASVLQWLAVGVFINGLARLPHALIQGAGRPDLTARLHLAELPVYLVALLGIAHLAGILGVAVAWTVRATLDAVVLFIIASRLVPQIRWPARRLIASGAFGLGLLLVGILQTATVARFVVLMIGVPSFLGLSWIFLVSADERALMKSHLLRTATLRGSA